MSAPIKIHNAIPSHTLVPLPAHEHAARRRRVEAAALPGLPGIPGIPGSRPRRQPKPPVHRGRKTVETRNPPLPPLGWGLSKPQA